MRIAFSTISCPTYDADQIVAAALDYGYDGVELYALGGLRLVPDLLKSNLVALQQAFIPRGVPIVSLNSWAHLTAVDSEELAAQEAQIMRSLELASALHCPLVKTFGGDFPPGELPARVYDNVASVVLRVCARARELGVRLMLETHDSFSRGATVAEVLRRADNDAFAVLWDVFHTFRMGETIEQTDALIGARVAHLHVKDAVRRDDDWHFVLLGEGEVPVAPLIDRMAQRGYEGYVSVDWEKMWQPEIDEPEIALPRFATVLRRYIDDAYHDKD